MLKRVLLILAAALASNESFALQTIGLVEDHCLQTDMGYVSCSNQGYSCSVYGSEYGSAAVPDDQYEPYICDTNAKWCKREYSYIYINSTTVSNGECYVYPSYLTYTCNLSNSCTSNITHCKSGYYKNGNTCIRCPDSGYTDSEHNNGGITSCYKTGYSSGNDTYGSYNYSGASGNKCYYTS